MQMAKKRQTRKQILAAIARRSKARKKQQLELLAAKGKTFWIRSTRRSDDTRSMLVFKATPELTPEEATTYWGWRNQATFSMCESEFVATTGVKLPLGKMIKVRLSIVP
jgi:hypothetical protein